MTEYLIANSVLEAIVRGALESDERIRFHSPLPLVKGRGVEVAVEGEECRVTVHVQARFGEFLPSLADEIRRKVARALGHMTGLAVTAVDVVVSGVFPVES